MRRARTAATASSTRAQQPSTSAATAPKSSGARASSASAARASSYSLCCRTCTLIVRPASFIPSLAVGIPPSTVAGGAMSIETYPSRFGGRSTLPRGCATKVQRGASSAWPSSMVRPMMVSLFTS